MSSEFGQEQNNPYTVKPELAVLESDPTIDCMRLQGPRKSESATPEQPTITLRPETPIETSLAPDGTRQDLMAVIALGENAAVGVVRSFDAKGHAKGLLTLFGEEHSESGISIGQLHDDEEVNLGRDSLIESVKSSGLSGDAIEGIVAGLKGVSQDHATVTLSKGNLTVSDRNSLNGSAVYGSVGGGWDGSSRGRLNRWQLESTPIDQTEKDSPRLSPVPEYKMAASRSIDPVTGESMSGPTYDDPRKNERKPIGELRPVVAQATGNTALAHIEAPESPGNDEPTRRSALDGQRKAPQIPVNTEAAPSEIDEASVATTESRPLNVEQDPNGEPERMQVNNDIAKMISRVPDDVIVESFTAALQKQSIRIAEGADQIRVLESVRQTFRNGTVNLSQEHAIETRKRIVDNGFHESAGGIWGVAPDPRSVQGRILIGAKEIIEDIVVEVSKKLDEGQGNVAVELPSATSPSSNKRPRRRPVLRERELPI